jgi:hypothetical protein
MNTLGRRRYGRRDIHRADWRASLGAMDGGRTLDLRLIGSGYDRVRRKGTARGDGPARPFRRDLSCWCIILMYWIHALATEQV